MANGTEGTQDRSLSRDFIKAVEDNTKVGRRLVDEYGKIRRAAGIGGRGGIGGGTAALFSGASAAIGGALGLRANEGLWRKRALTAVQIATAEKQVTAERRKQLQLSNTVRRGRVLAYGW